MGKQIEHSCYSELPEMDVQEIWGDSRLDFSGQNMGKERATQRELQRYVKLGRALVFWLSSDLHQRLWSWGKNDKKELSLMIPRAHDVWGIFAFPPARTERTCNTWAISKVRYYLTSGINGSLG